MLNFIIACMVLLCCDVIVNIFLTPPNSPFYFLTEMGGRRCRVVFSYAPQHDDELALCVGQTITILQEVEEGWWKGVLDGQVKANFFFF